MAIPTGCNLSTVLAAAVMLLSLVACEGDGARVALPGKVGAAGELVVVAETAVWEGPAGDTVKQSWGVVSCPFGMSL